ncbi:PTS sugar transporter subunit IIC [Thermoanaerobacterium sp. R66]|uniref:PTS sugar transporter subunit IIC n=1 Tax=Thermoanaerobacterium sp. R66 TaxID=2742479 RepID=UPI0017521E44|nr:PTS sugar transporter subunit IIC [Thermoanaerobacterium sp. R66]HHV74956.1 PTS sugar transporter subunit IIC [Thermoanaerobacterium sp.]
MKKIMSFLEKYFVPIAAKFGSERHLVAIRDGFAMIMPLILAGAFAVLINNLPIQAYQNFMVGIFGKSWTTFGGNLWNGTFAVMSIILVVSISYNLALSYESNGIGAGLVSFASLLMLYTPSAKDWAIPYAFLGAQGLFVSIIVALISTEIFVRLLGNPKLVIKMPEGVPPAVAKSFAALLPSLIVLSIWALFKSITVALGLTDIHQAIFNAIQAPLTGLADTLGSAIVVAFLIHFLWFFGLHGTNILGPILNAVYLPAINDNIAALKAGKAIPHIVTMPFFDAFVHLGGAGTTIGLIIAIYIASRRKKKRNEMQNIANLAIAPGIFNINEPMIFGMPLVLNPIFFIPFILTPIILTIISYFAISLGIVPRTIAMMPWTTPPIIGGFLVTGSIRGAILALVNLIISVVIYLPFVLAAEKIEEKSNKTNEEALVEEKVR